MTEEDQEEMPLPAKWSEASDPLAGAVRQKLVVVGNNSLGEGRRLTAAFEAMAMLNDGRAELLRQLAELGAQLAEVRDDFIRYSGPHEIARWVDGDHAVCTCGSEWRYYGCEWLAEKTKTAAQLAQLREVDDVHQAQQPGQPKVASPLPAGVDIATHTLAIPFLAQDLDRLIAAADTAGTDVVTFAAKAVLAAIFEVETGGGL